MPRQITLEEFRDNLRQSKSKLLKNLSRKMLLISKEMERKLKDDKKGAWRRWVNRSGRLAMSIKGDRAIIEGKPAITLQAGGQFLGKDVFYASILEFGSKAQTITVPAHTVRRHRVRRGKKKVFRGPFSRGPYSYQKPAMQGRFFLRRTVEWGTEQFPQDLREMLTFAIAGKTIDG